MGLIFDYKNQDNIPVLFASVRELYINTDLFDLTYNILAYMEIILITLCSLWYNSMSMADT